jgi:hypothetical protein
MKTHDPLRQSFCLACGTRIDFAELRDAPELREATCPHCGTPHLAILEEKGLEGDDGARLLVAKGTVSDDRGVAAAQARGHGT